MAQGKRAGARRGEKRRAGFQPRLLLLAGGITALVVAWGYLVYAAIDFGQSARGGESRAWWFLVVASLGAVACLFAGLMLVARLTRALGITSAPAPSPAAPGSPAGPASGAARDSAPEALAPAGAPAAPRQPGGRRAAR